MYGKFMYMLIIISLLIILIKNEEEGLYYPSILTLLSQKNVLVTNNGIHFYDSNLENEEKDKLISLDIPVSDSFKTALAQFSENDGGYILVLAKEILYFFNADGTNFSIKDLTDLIESNYYCLTPYKKEDNNLYYIISYVNREDLTINLNIFKYSFISDENISINLIKFKVIISLYNSDATEIPGVNCIFMFEPTYNYDVLTCFYSAQYPGQVHCRSFDPKNNYNEITENFAIYNNDPLFTTNPGYASAVTNLEKRKALVFFVYVGGAYWMTFDFENNFSEVKYITGLNLLGNYPKNRMYFCRQTKEFFIITEISTNSCQKYVLIFNKDFSLKYSNTIIINQCYRSNYFAGFFKNGYYFIVADNDDASVKELFYFQIIDLNITESVEDPIIINENLPNLESETTIIEIIPETTIIEVIPETTIIEVIPETTIIEIPPETTIIEVIPETTIIEIPPETTIIEIPETTIIEKIPETTIIEIIPETTIIEIPETTIIEIPPETTIIEKIPETTIIEIIPETTIITTIIDSIYSTNPEIITEHNIIITEKATEENTENFLNNDKCKTSSRESSIYNLCTSCNEGEGYFPVNMPNSKNNFMECYSENTKPNNFYFNISENKYKVCYETCLTCEGEGDEFNNNCLECDLNYIKKPDSPGTKNCVPECLYSYYYTSYGQYKCNPNSFCPEDQNIYIKELKKCTNDCSKEEIYKYEYGGKCLNNCPESTFPDINERNKCKDINIGNCSLTENEIIDSNDFISSDGIDLNVKNYINEYFYTQNHISIYQNDKYSISIYKELDCIEELSLNIPKVDFGTCYLKVQNSINEDDKVIITLISEKKEQQSNKISYSFYHPKSGEKLDDTNLCKDEEIVIKESFISQLNESKVDFNSAIFLTQQNIDIFNLSSRFYTDICFHFDSPNGKDIPLKERISIYFPNISLCDKGCSSKGINFTTNESICECKISNLINNDLIEGNAFLSNSLGEIADIISNSNLDVLKCFKEVFNKKNISKGHGGFIILALFIIEIIFSCKHLIFEIQKITVYIFHKTEKYLQYMKTKNQNPDTITYKDKTKKKRIINPPKKKEKVERKKIKKSIEINNTENKRKNYDYIKSNEGLKEKLSKSPQKILYNMKTTNTKKLNIFSFKKKQKTQNMDNVIEIEEYLKTDIDELEYDDAIKKDKRTFCEFYWDKLKEKQMIIDTFCNKDNIRPISIKIILFVLNIDLYFVINGLFFSEEYIIELYHLEKEDEFFTFFPRSIGRFFYATIVGVIIGIIIDCIFIEEKKIKRIFIREKEDDLKLKNEVALIIKSLKKRYKIFLFVCFFITIISWYYVSCFNNVYPGVKIEWIKSSITIILIVQLISLLIVFLEALLRELSFKCKSEKAFKLKQIVS